MFKIIPNATDYVNFVMWVSLLGNVTFFFSALAPVLGGDNYLAVLYFPVALALSGSTTVSALGICLLLVVSRINKSRAEANGAAIPTTYNWFFELVTLAGFLFATTIVIVALHVNVIIAGSPLTCVSSAAFDFSSEEEATYFLNGGDLQLPRSGPFTWPFEFLHDASRNCWTAIHYKVKR